MNVSKAASLWGLSERRVRLLCSEGAIAGVVKNGRSYLIPIDAVKPFDKRHFRGKDISEKFIPLFSEIGALKAQLNKLRPLTKGELEKLRENFLVEFTYNSNAIEGSTLTLSETALALEGVTFDQKPLRDYLDAVGHRDAFLFIQSLVNKKVKISERVIKQIHSLVLISRAQDKGIYRSIPVRISGAFHEPPQPYLIPGKMEELLLNENKNKHPLEKIALFHLDFEGIHPFIDGNGRTGRLLMNLMLMREGYPAIDVKFTDRSKYYNCFEEYYKNNDSSAMVLLIANYVKERLINLIDILS